MIQRKLKFILILIVLAGAGIVIVLGSWLYGSYTQRMELFLATAERTMFDAIQETVQKQERAGAYAYSKRSRRYTTAAPTDTHRPYTRKLVEHITRAFPQISADSLSHMLDSMLLLKRAPVIAYRGAMPSSTRSTRPETVTTLRLTSKPDVRPAHLLPGFLFGPHPFDSTAVDLLKATFAEGLAANGIQTDFEFDIVKAEKKTVPAHTDSSRTLAQLDPPSFDSVAHSGLSIRPILIDPENGRFITVAFNRPWQYLLYSLSWQLIISVALVATTIGCFVYLFHTIFKQNKIALLRKAFVNNMTHELRTPVATVSAAVQALQNYAAMEDEERRDRYLTISKEELDHLSLMIDNVLYVAEGEHHAIKRLHSNPYDIWSLVERCIAKARIHHHAGQTAIRLEGTASPEIVYGDQEHMRNVVTNLIDNAIKYGATNVIVRLTIPEMNPFFELSVQDDGIGIPEAYQQQVFEPFFRVPQEGAIPVKGIGLGLAYVKQVIMQHGGHVRLHSNPGQGTTFILSIPKKASP